MTTLREHACALTVFRESEIMTATDAPPYSPQPFYVRDPLTSLVREYRTPGSARGLSGNRRSCLNGTRMNHSKTNPTRALVGIMLVGAALGAIAYTLSTEQLWGHRFHLFTIPPLPSSK